MKTWFHKIALLNVSLVLIMIYQNCAQNSLDVDVQPLASTSSSTSPSPHLNERLPRILSRSQSLGSSKIFVMTGASSANPPIYNPEQIRHHLNLVQEQVQQMTHSRMSFDFVYGGVLQMPQSCDEHTVNSFLQNATFDHLSQNAATWGPASDYAAVIFIAPAFFCGAGLGGAAYGKRVLCYEHPQPGMLRNCIIHEVGHVLGLGHSGVLLCTPEQWLNNSCSYEDYLDGDSIMADGGRATPNFLAFQLSQIGHLTEQNVVDIDHPGTYRLFHNKTNPLSLQPLLLRYPIFEYRPSYIGGALRNYISVEYKPSANPTNPGSVQFRFAGEGGGTALISINGKTSYDQVGQVFQDLARGFRFQVAAVTPEYADLVVTRTPASSRKLQITLTQVRSCSDFDVRIQSSELIPSQHVPYLFVSPTRDRSNILECQEWSQVDSKTWTCRFQSNEITLRREEIIWGRWNQMATWTTLLDGSCD